MTKQILVNMTVRELLQYVDRSNAEVNALATKLEMYANQAVEVQNAIQSAVDDFEQYNAEC